MAGQAPLRARPLPSPPPRRRLAAWLYTGPLGHLWATAADVAAAWFRWARERARSARELPE